MLARKKKMPKFANEKWPTLLANQFTKKPYFEFYNRKKMPTNLVGQPIFLVGLALHLSK